jgi:putative membrane-bound dehydrogenase-like protein
MFYPAGAKGLLLPLLFLSPVFALPGSACPSEPIQAAVYQVGVAKVDITPPYQIRLSGFGFRKQESEGVTSAIAAKALAIGADQDPPAILITVDNLGIPSTVTADVASRLQRRAGIPVERLAITSTHTHTAPMLKGVAPTLFGSAIPANQQERIDRYTHELTDKLEQVALEALQRRGPSRITWGIGSVSFAVNRRTKGGPVDHDLPLLVVRDELDKIKALYISYACHCVTLSNNKISGDWAGYAQDLLEREHPGSVALLSIGCGGDANPSSGVTGDRTDIAEAQGAEIAREVKRLLKGYLAPLAGPLTAKVKHFDLPLANLPTRAQWQERANKKGAVGYHARVQLDRLDRGIPLTTNVAYSVQTWNFGNQLALIFLPGEVVVDYALRLKRELDPGQIWINAYANDAPCYIPSERVLHEGGYEAVDAMVYYDKPGPFRPGLEKQIIDAVHETIPPSFNPPFDPKRLPSPPLSPQQSLATLQTAGHLAIELVAAEPLVESPVAIDFGPDGRLWVAEMRDYPSGLDGKLQPGGRIKVLEDTRGTGRFDKATVFLDGIPFPTGITVWRKGVLICAAPDILYAEDSTGSGKADIVRKLFSGFATHNYQARVNSLAFGLDNWVHGSGGLFGGTIHSFAGGPPHELTNRDFRMNPDTGAIEPASGRTQQGRVRDDWGNWFGCDNTNLLWHYPLVDHYLRRNPHLAPPSGIVYVPDYPESNLLYPVKKDVQMFLLSGPPRRVTAACGLGIYRDDLLGNNYPGSALICEPVNLLVHRLLLQPHDSTFSGRRAPDESTAEFLAGSDNWSRPVQARTGPDGAVWVVDMYRLVIEHPQWIPPEDLAKLDVRAGNTSGRIYRIYPRDKRPRPILHLDKLVTAGLVAALDTPNGPQRDLAQQMLVWKQDKSAIPLLEPMAASHARPQTRLHALCALDGLGGAKTAILTQALADPHPGVRRHAVRLSEHRLGQSPELDTAFLRLLEDPDLQIQLQLAYSLGEWKNPQAGRALAKLARKRPDDPYLLASILSSVNRSNIEDVVADVLHHRPAAVPQFTGALLGLAASLGNKESLQLLLESIAAPQQAGFAAWQMKAMAEMLEALERHGQTLEQVLTSTHLKNLQALFDRARSLVADTHVDEPQRLAAVPLLGRQPDHRLTDAHLLAEQLIPQNSADLQGAVVAALGRIKADTIPELFLARWDSLSPSIRIQILEVLMSRETWLRQLLEQITKDPGRASQIDARHRQLLLEHRNASIRQLAVRALAGSTNADRKRVLADHRQVLSMPGSTLRGKEVFAKRCAVCHRLEGVGHEVGPDLAGVATKSPEALLIAILDPNQAVDQRYVHYVAATKDGRVHHGILASESATSITLKDQEGKETVLLRSQLEELRSTGKSLMPEGLEKDLTRQDLADVITYLRERK